MVASTRVVPLLPLVFAAIACGGAIDANVTKDAGDGATVDETTGAADSTAGQADAPAIEAGTQADGTVRDAEAGTSTSTDSSAPEAGADSATREDSRSSTDVGTDGPLSTEASTQDAASDGAMAAADMPSRQMVSFTIKNDGTADKYVLVEGYRCGAYAVSAMNDGGTTPVNVWADTNCPCECPGSPRPGPATLALLHSGESQVVTWDARTRRLITDSVYCPPSQQTVSYVRPIAFPVAAGDYLATIGWFSAPPANCQTHGTPQYQCSLGNASGWPAPDGFVGLCTVPETVDTPFTLPPMGDVSVDVSLP